MTAKLSIGKIVVFLVLLSAMVSGVATYVTLTARGPLSQGPNTVMGLLLADLVIFIVLGAIIVRRIWRVWQDRRQGTAGSRLHVRLVFVFGLVALVPAVLVALFSALFFYVGVQSWFSNQVKTAVHEAQSVAQAYLKEHQQVLKGDILAMANDLNRQAARLSLDSARLNQVVDTQSLLRELTEVLVFDGTGRVLARSGYTFSLELEPLSDPTMNRARQGELILFLNDSDNRVRALTRLDRYVDTFLYVGRSINPQVLSYVQTAQEAANSYSQLEGRRFALQAVVTVIYITVALLLLLVAVWYGLNFANRIVRPVGALIRVTTRVREGDLSARVEDRLAEDDLGMLGREFNRMTDQLESQHTELLQANAQLDHRRRFTEAVLGGVSAGVISLDPKECVVMMNPSAQQLLRLNTQGRVIGQPLRQLFPEFGAILDRVRRNMGRAAEDQIILQTPAEAGRTLHVRVAAEEEAGEIKGFVLTFDDVSELLSAQRKAAWGDVARRIAHEIKNPLTPIQLSAERLKRKYGKEIASDPDVFQQCTDTIIRQVDDIRRMVNEFSAFARMPHPTMKRQNVLDIIRQALFLQSTANTHIRYTSFFDDDPLLADCDSHQISQVMTNLLQNAADAIEGRLALQHAEKVWQITVHAHKMGDHVVIRIEDNGKGLPTENRDRLTEPYVTTRSKGTGLGLAIVKKIMEDHHGTLTLTDRLEGGAVVTIQFPIAQSEQKDGFHGS